MNTVASNETFIIAAYVVTWTGLLGYVWRLARKERSARAAYERIAREHDGVGRS